jgi:hypothetical protein
VPLPLLEEPLPLPDEPLVDDPLGDEPLPEELLPECDEPLPELDEPLPLLEDPLPEVDEPLLLFDDPLLLGDEPLPEFDELLFECEEPLPLLEVPLPELDGVLLLLDDPLPDFEDPLPDPEEPLPAGNEPLLELDEPLFPPVFAADGGRPLSSVSVSSHRILGAIEIESVRVPALITSDFTEDVANVALEPSTAASIEAPLLINETLMTFASPEIPLQVKTPSTSVGVTLIITRFSRASNPRKCAEGLMNLRAR